MPNVWSRIAWKVRGHGGKVSGRYELEVYEKLNAGEFDGARWYVLKHFSNRGAPIDPLCPDLVLDFEVLPNGRRIDYLALDKFYGSAPRPFIVEGEQ